MATLSHPPFPVVPGVRFALIPGYVGYAAATDGTIWTFRKRGQGCRGVFSERWKQMKGSPSHGYQNVKLICSDGIGRNLRVHRLVLETFVGPCPPGMECRHYPDRNTFNNQLSNICWGTKSENTLDQVRHGTHYLSEKMRKLSNESIAEIRASDETAKELSARFNINLCYVYQIRNYDCRT